MFATVTNWRLAQSVQPGEVKDRLLQEMVSRSIEIARERGILDVIMVEVNPDRLIVISSYETVEGAVASGPPLLAFLGEHFGDKLELVSRTIGRAYEPSDFVTLDRHKTHEWREVATEMYANINLYRIDPAIRDPDAFADFLHSIAEKFLALMAELDLLDMLVVRTGEDSMIVVRLFENPEAFDRSMQRALKVYPPDLFGGMIEVTENVRGRAFDAEFLLAH